MRDEERVNNRINREDLFLLMESYKNMIESNLTLMEKQDNTLGKINQTCISLSKIGESVNNGFNELRKSMDIVHTHHNECAKAQICYNDALKDIFRDGQIDSIKLHSGQNIKIFGLVGALCTIIIAIIGLVYKLWPTATP